MELRSRNIIPVRQNPQQPQNHSDEETVIDPQIAEKEMGERVEPENPGSRMEEMVDAKVSHKKSKEISELDIRIDPEIAGKEMGDRVEQEIAGSRMEKIVQAEFSAQNCKENREPDISQKEMEKQQLDIEEKMQEQQQEVEEEEIPGKGGKVKKKPTRGFSITVNCSMSKVGGLFESESLTQNELNNLKSSCFKYFVDLQTTEIHMNTSVVSEVVRARVSPGKLKYQIAGNELQFKPIDITLILGLKIGRIPIKFLYMEKKVPTVFREEYFGRKSITEKKIKNAIEIARKEHLVDEDDIHRLNRLFLLSTCLIPDASLTIDVRYADLASNLEEFDDFPWGTVVFDLLETSLDAVATHGDNNKIVYGIAGCVLAFIIWAYIQLPCLGPRRLEDAPLFPRMLGWKNLPGKTTGRGSIHRKLYPPTLRLRGKQIPAVPRFFTPYEENLPIVIEAKRWQEELDKNDVPSLEGIMQDVAKKIEGVAATLLKEQERQKCRSSQMNYNNKDNTTKNKNDKSAPARKDVHINKKKPAAALSGKSSVNTISQSLRTTTRSTSMDKTNTAPTTLKGKPSTTPKGEGKAKTTLTKKKANNTSTPSAEKKSNRKKKGKRIIDIVAPIDVFLSGMATTRTQEKKGVQEEGFVLKKRKTPEGKKAGEKEPDKTEEEKEKKARPAKKQRVIQPPRRKQPLRIKLTDIVTKNEESKNLSHVESGMECPETTKKRKVDERDKHREEENQAEAAEKEDAAVDGLASLVERNDLLDSTMSSVQDLPLLNSDLNADIELNEVDLDSMHEENQEDVQHEEQEQEQIDGTTSYNKALENFKRSWGRLDKKNKGNNEAKKFSAKISKIMATSFLNRTTTKKQTDSLKYYWRLNDKAEYKNRVMMTYGHGLEVSVNHFHSLENPNWLVGEIIEAYICLLLRWYGTRREKTDPEEQFLIVRTVYFSTLVSGADMYGNYTKHMKDKTFLALSPEDRIRTGKLKLRGAPVNILKRVFEMQGHQVNPFKAKGILIPCQVSDNHWLLFNFSFVEGKVSVYDSLGFKKASKQQIALEKMLPYLVWAADSGGSVVVDLEVQWEREYVKCAEQEDGDSCGAYLLAFIDCVLRDRSPCFDRDPGLMRNRIAMDLVECGVEAPKLRKKSNFLPG